jgi:23S rRNA (cytosine1962-C5)-methyltransferase
VSLRKVIVKEKAVRNIQSGHPWVWKQDIVDPAPVGTPIILCSPNGKNIGFALQDSGDIGARVLSKNPDKIPDLLKKRIQFSFALRQKLLPPNTTAYRLINGAGDGLEGLVVDIYNQLAVLRVYASCWEHHLDAIVDALDTLPCITDIYRRFGVRKVDGKKGGMLLYGSEPPDTLIIQENGVRFLVRPKIGQKTGLFLDQREHRIFLASRAKDQTLINLFCYTGGFSVHAAVAGAKHVCSVDIAKGALEDAKENFRLNGLNPDQHEFICTDVFSWKPNRKSDIVICDPPSLSHKKQSDKAAAQSYTKLAKHSAQMVDREGILALSSCSSRLNTKQWEKASLEGVRTHGRWSWLWRAYEPPDHPVSTAHPEGRYLKFSLLCKQR